MIHAKITGNNYVTAEIVVRTARRTSYIDILKECPASIKNQ